MYTLTKGYIQKTTQDHTLLGTDVFLKTDDSFRRSFRKYYAC